MKQKIKGLKTPTDLKESKESKESKRKLIASLDLVKMFMMCSDLNLQLID
jgi:hypothetical protein